MVKRQISGKRQQRQHYIRRQQISTTTVHKNMDSITLAIILQYIQQYIQKTTNIPT